MLEFQSSGCGSEMPRALWVVAVTGLIIAAPVVTNMAVTILKEWMEKIGIIIDIPRRKFPTLTDYFSYVCAKAIINCPSYVFVSTCTYVCEWFGSYVNCSAAHREQFFIHNSISAENF
jgi:hypothetical protein